MVPYYQIVLRRTAAKLSMKAEFYSQIQQVSITHPHIDCDGVQVQNKHHAVLNTSMVEVCCRVEAFKGKWLQ